MGRIVQDGIRVLEAEGTIERSPHERALKKDELRGYLENVEAAILGADNCDRDVLSNAKSLKIVARHGIGYDNIDLAAATANGIIVTYTPDVNTIAVAEHAMALILSLARKIPCADASVKARKWEGLRFVGSELMGKTLGIIGLGRIGAETAKRALAFGMKVLYFDKYKEREYGERLGAISVPLDQLLAESDFVSIHTALTPETKGMIGPKEIALMKKVACLINTARGPIIDGKALTDALMEKRIAGAALDVFQTEPPAPDDALLSLNNVILTPHIAAYTVEAIRRMDVMAAEDVVKALQGRTPEHIANTEVLSSDRLRLKT